MIAAPPHAAPLTPGEARDRLAREWASRAPTTPAEIAAFYRESEHLAADLEAFHDDPGRQGWTAAIVYLAETQGLRSVVDIGCGVGHDLAALREAMLLIDLTGVEPNDRLRTALIEEVIADRVVSDVADAPIETADLLVCIDVLEHIPDPDTFLGGIARRAPIGCWLVEATATHDCGTPLHLKANRSWQPGRALEGAGWEAVQTQGRFRVWRRVREASVPRATLMLCAYRSVSLPTMRSILTMKDALHDQGWRVYMGGEAGIHRARNIAASRWYQETADDVFVMLDDDVTFTPADIEHLVAQCRAGHDVICAAYPVRDGGHLALRQQPGELWFGDGQPPIEIDYMATGFVAVHRRVIEAMVKTLPHCHAGTPFAHWPMFTFETIETEDGWEHLSEDYTFSRLARQLGFSIWLDQSIVLGHLGTVEINVRNMSAIHEATRG
jgi:SAM-dependent methyltransferase